MICSVGKGFTAPSRFLVRKSQKILGQNMHCRAAAIWSVQRKGHVSLCGSVGLERGQLREKRDVQVAAVRMTRRAQWFLINLPMAKRRDVGKRCAGG